MGEPRKVPRTFTDKRNGQGSAPGKLAASGVRMARITHRFLVLHRSQSGTLPARQELLCVRAFGVAGEGLGSDGQQPEAPRAGRIDEPEGGPRLPPPASEKLVACGWYTDGQADVPP